MVTVFVSLDFNSSEILNEVIDAIISITDMQVEIKESINDNFDLPIILIDSLSQKKNIKTVYRY